jgi:hypothetical protein
LSAEPDDEISDLRDIQQGSGGRHVIVCSVEELSGEPAGADHQAARTRPSVSAA